MRARVTILALSGLILGMAAGVPATAQQNMAHVHMGHVTDGWGDTPEGKGLLPTAFAEAAIAAKHAELAAAAGDLAGMQLHAGHVLNALDPDAMAQGPGLGYGLIRAAGGVAKHINLAAGSDGASDNVRLHATHVAASANSAIDRAKAAVSLARRIQASLYASDAKGLVGEMKAVTAQIAAGLDADGDGAIGWQRGEGGLAQADLHMGLMAKGEGM